MKTEISPAAHRSRRARVRSCRVGRHSPASVNAGRGRESSKCGPPTLSVVAVTAEWTGVGAATVTAGARGRVSATREPPRPFAYLSSPQRAALGVLRGGTARRPCRGDVIELRVARRPILFASIETPRPREPAGSARRGSGANFIGRVRPSPPAAHAEPGQLHAAPNLAPLGSAMSAPFAPGVGSVGDPPCCDKTPRREPGSPEPDSPQFSQPEPPIRQSSSGHRYRMAAPQGRRSTWAAAVRAI